MILVYITCKNEAEAKNIGITLLKKRLAACFVVIPKVTSFYFWSTKTGKIEKSKESILLVKTLEKKFLRLEQEVKKLHSYAVPCILVIPLAKVNKKYLTWLKEEV